MATPIDVDAWLNLLPARSLLHEVPSPAARRALAQMPASTTVAALETQIVRGRREGGIDAQACRDLGRAVRDTRRAIRTRGIVDIRPPRPNWIVPDSVGFALEGKSSNISTRKSRVGLFLERLAYEENRIASERRALLRAADLIAGSRSHPTWFYWYSPQTVDLVRRTSHETLFEMNSLMSRTMDSLGASASISTWEESIDVVSRRLPLGIAIAQGPTRRCAQLIRKLENLGVHALGGLTILSTDSMRFLQAVHLSTLEGCSNALRGALRPLVS